MTTFSKLDWALVPGPVDVPEILDSQGQYDIAQYTPREIADLMLSIGGTRLVQSGADWWDWQASHESHGEAFELTMTLFETEPIAWGGSSIIGCSDTAVLLEFWRRLRESHPRIWLHNSNCVIFNPTDFQHEFVR